MVEKRRGGGSVDVDHAWQGWRSGYCRGESLGV